MSVLDIISWLVLGLAVSASVAFGITSFVEKEWRALLLVSLLGLVGSSPLACVLMLNFSGREWFLVAMLCVAIFGLFLLVIPFGRSRPLMVIGPQPRLDERDALFHRFYRIEPGTEEFKSYYAQHPEKLDFDNRVRAMPGLTEPGSKTFDETTSTYQTALTSQVGYINKFSDEDLEVLKNPPASCSSHELTKRIKGFAKYLGADLVGSTRLNQAYVYSHIGRAPGTFGAPIDLSHHTHALVLAVRMSHSMMSQAPLCPASTETSLRYLQIVNMTMVIARYINLIGYSARAHVDGNYRVMCVPLAVDAGLGELGRLGLLVTRRFGPRVRLAVLTTNLPLEQDSSSNFGVQEFCEICAKCAVNCPSGSVDKGKKGQYRGVEKWKTEMDSCYRTWRLLGSDCGVCIKVCPYSHPDTFMHKLVRLVISRNPVARRIMLYADDVFYGRKPLQRARPPFWHQSCPPVCQDKSNK